MRFQTGEIRVVNAAGEIEQIIPFCRVEFEPLLANTGAIMGQAILAARPPVSLQETLCGKQAATLY